MKKFNDKFYITSKDIQDMFGISKTQANKALAQLRGLNIDFRVDGKKFYYDVHVVLYFIGAGSEKLESLANVCSRFSKPGDKFQDFVDDVCYVTTRIKVLKDSIKEVSTEEVDKLFR